MNSKVPNQATWKTSDGSAWWLRSTLYSQPNGPEEWPNGRANPNGDYVANCYMDLWRLPSNENTIQFNDRKCDYRSRSYYCQPVRPKPKPPVPPAPPPARRLVAWSSLKKGIKEEVYYFLKGEKVPNFNHQSNGPNMLRIAPDINYNYKSEKRAWPGYTQTDNFAVRWSGFLLIPTFFNRKIVGTYYFRLKSDDGSNLYIDNKKIINNDGLHGSGTAKYGKNKLVKGQHNLRVEYFESGGHQSCQLSWKFKSTSNWMTIRAKNLRYQIGKGFREEVFYVAVKDRMPDLNKVRAANQRVVKVVNYPRRSDKENWKHFTRNHDFAVRWSGVLQITKAGTYRFSLNSDDGSRMFLNGKRAINNDGLHAWRQAETTMNFRSASKNDIIVEYFQKADNAGISFRYMGADTGDKMSYVGTDGAVHVRYLNVKTPPPPKKKKKMTPEEMAKKANEAEKNKNK
jgi:hypothetical protein